jgi:glutathione S-transferase
MSLLPKYILYYSVRSPFARRVRILLQRLALPCEMREISVFDPPPELYEANPLGLVPVLVLRDANGKPALSLPDSSTILEYINDTYGKVWPTDPAAKVQVRAASTLAVGIMTETVKWFLETQRPNLSQEALNESLESIERTLVAVSAHPWKGMPWKVSDFQLTQAGYDLAIALEYLHLRMNQLGWFARFPELARFLDLHRTRQDLAPTAPPALQQTV